MNNQKNNSIHFPSTEPKNCPDYWTSVKDEDDKNVKDQDVVVDHI